MKEIIFSFILILAFSNFGYSQMPVSELDKKTHLEQLKAGILLVQLPNGDEKIKMLRKHGNERRAKKEEKEIDKIRKSIIKEFQNKWDYSEIYFFEAKNAKEVFQLKTNFLLDSNMKPIDKLLNTEHIYSVRYGPGNPNGEVYSYNGNGFQIRYIKDGTLQTIKYDIFFKAMVFGYYFFPIKKVIRDQITSLNLKLHNAHRKKN